MASYYNGLIGYNVRSFIRKDFVGGVCVEFTRINHENLSLRFWIPELSEVYLSADPVLQKDSFFILVIFEVSWYIGTLQLEGKVNLDKISSS